MFIFLIKVVLSIATSLIKICEKFLMYIQDMTNFEITLWYNLKNAINGIILHIHIKYIY